VRTRIAAGFGYGGQHSMDPGSLFAQFAGWRIMAPSSAFDCIGLFNTAMQFNDPVLFLEHGLLYNEESPVPVNAAGEVDMDYYVAYGKANVLRAGGDVTVLTYLTGVGHCLKAAEELAGQGVSAEVLDLRTLDYAGMDFAAIGASVKKTGAVLIVEQGARSLTLGARIADGFSPVSSTIWIIPSSASPPWMCRCPCRANWSRRCSPPMNRSAPLYSPPAATWPEPAALHHPLEDTES